MHIFLFYNFNFSNSTNCKSIINTNFKKDELFALPKPTNVNKLSSQHIFEHVAF